jgi:hypothetical protein
VRIVITDDESNGTLCESSVDLFETGPSYVQFSEFGLRADQVSPRKSANYEITLTNLRRASEGTAIYVAIYT